MLRAKCKEMAEDCREYEMLNQDSWSVKACVDYMYHEPVYMHFYKVEFLTELAHFLGMKALCQKIFRQLRRLLSPRTFYVTNALAKKYQQHSLMKVCQEFSLNNFQAISTTDKFIYMDRTDIITHLSLCGEKVSSWSTLCDGLSRWAHADYGTRSAAFRDMFDFVPLQELPLDYVEKLIKNEVLVKESPPHLGKLQRFLWSRRSEGILLFTEDSATPKSFHPRMRRFFQLEAIHDPTDFNKYSAVSVDKYVYLITDKRGMYRCDHGGSEEGWCEMPQMESKHGIRPLVAGTRDCIYVLGHRDSAHGYSEVFSRHTQCWSSLPSLTRPTDGCCTATVEDRIYILGGKDGEHTLPLVEMLDTRTHVWGMSLPMPRVLKNLTAAVLKAKIYVIGTSEQCHRKSIVDCFDTSTGYWTSLQAFSFQHEYVLHTACVADQEIYLVGNRKGSSSTTISRLNLTMKTCEEIYQLVEDVSLSTVVTVRSRSDFDFIVRVGNEEIPTNKKRLEAGSRYFKAMFAHDMVEKRSGIVNLTLLDPEIVRVCINFICGNAKPAITEENIEELVFAADYLSAEGLLTRVSHHLATNLSHECLNWTRNLARDFSLSGVTESCFEYVADTFVSFSRLEHFLQIEKSFLSSLLSSGDLEVDEVDKYEAIRRWVGADTESRGDDFEELFCEVNLVKVSTNYLKETIANDDLVKANKKCCIKVMKAKRTRNREYEVLLGFDECSSSFWTFVPRLGKWKEFSGLEPFDGMILVELDSQVYGLHSPKNKLFRLDIEEESMSWVEVTGMNNSSATIEFAVALEECIYAFGDSNAEKYCEDEDEWMEITALEDIIDSAAVVLEDKIYAIGGWEDEETPVATVRHYDTDCDSWWEATPMNTARSEAAAAAYRGKIYVAGGLGVSFVSLSSAEVYDPRDDVWTSIVRMQSPRSGISACIVDHKMYIYGGYEWIDCYDFFENRWSRQSSPVDELSRRSVVSTRLKHGALELFDDEPDNDCVIS